MSAAAMTSISITRVASGIFYYHAFKDVGGIFTLVGGSLQGLVYFLPFDELDRVLLFVKKAADRLATNPVRLVFQGIHLDAAFADKFKLAAEKGDPLVDDLAGFEDQER